ncbi:hypothetical protein Droror1_Dr00006581 [Drosera rotundifolia]
MNHSFNQHHNPHARPTSAIFTKIKSSVSLQPTSYQQHFLSHFIFPKPRQILEHDQQSIACTCSNSTLGYHPQEQPADTNNLSPGPNTQPQAVFPTQPDIIFQPRTLPATKSPPNVNHQAIDTLATSQSHNLSKVKLTSKILPRKFLEPATYSARAATGRVSTTNHSFPP